MLVSLSIRDFAIIDRSQIDFHSGMTALTGETGAGKSILLGAMNLLLGARADSGSVREGAEKAEVSALFDIHDAPVAKAWLSERELNMEDECQLRRVVSADGRSRAYINGRPTTLADLKALSALLINIHGQHEHQTLVMPDVQRELLDKQGGHSGLVDNLQNAYQSLSRAQRALSEHQQNAAQADLRIHELNRLLKDFDAIEVDADGIDDLVAEHQRNSNLQRIAETANTTVQLLDNEQGVIDQLRSLQQHIDNWVALDPSMSPLAELLENADIQLSELSSSANHALNRLDADPERIEWVDAQFSALFSISRKHRIDLTEVPQFYQQLQQERDQLENADQAEHALQKALSAAKSQYNDAAAKLSDARANVAEHLSRDITERLHQLSMSSASFVIKHHVDEQRVHKDGFDTLEFCIAANAGQSAKPISKVASGGELSRISLAIQVCLAQTLTVPTLIFDEVDTGIGGAVAQIVGKQMREIGERAQVLCVTHLAQVAGCAHQQLKVLKTQGADHVKTEVESLQEAQRVDELARMLGGEEITDSARQMA
ncbi:MAG: DNA repair protein RecN, partial [Gammaproteobacteria bacterium]|nr:DNA repair protein RecN [Gammaproteobacteria bacterium]